MATDKIEGDKKTAEAEANFDAQNAEIAGQTKTPDPSYEPVDTAAQTEVIQGKAGDTIQAVYHSLTPAKFTHEGTEYHMERGFEYELPAKNDYVKSLVAQNILVVNK